MTCCGICRRWKIISKVVKSYKKGAVSCTHCEVWIEGRRIKHFRCTCYRKQVRMPSPKNRMSLAIEINCIS